MQTNNSMSFHFSIIVFILIVIVSFLIFVFLSVIYKKIKSKLEENNNWLIILIPIIIGVVVILYLGFADRGGNIGLSSSENEKWDRISDDGDFIAQDGIEYSYYLLVRGDTYEFSGEPCESIVELREKLSKIKPENTVIIIDSFAVSSKIKEAKELLKEMGIRYEMEEIS